MHHLHQVDLWDWGMHMTGPSLLEHCIWQLLGDLIMAHDIGPADSTSHPALHTTQDKFSGPSMKITRQDSTPHAFRLSRNSSESSNQFAVFKLPSKGSKIRPDRPSSRTRFPMLIPDAILRRVVDTGRPTSWHSLYVRPPSTKPSRLAQFRAIGFRSSRIVTSIAVPPPSGLDYRFSRREMVCCEPGIAVPVMVDDEIVIEKHVSEHDLQFS